VKLKVPVITGEDVVAGVRLQQNFLIDGGMGLIAQVWNDDAGFIESRNHFRYQG